MGFKLRIVMWVGLVAACSGAAPPSAGPSVNPQPSPSISSSSGPAASVPSSGQRAPELERVLPLAVGGFDYERQSFAGDQPFRVPLDAYSKARLITLMCRDRATVAIARIVKPPPYPWSVTAYYVAAANSAELREAIVDEIFGVLVPGDATPATIRTELHAGRPILLNRPWPTAQADRPPLFAYETGDLLFTLEGVPSMGWAEQFLSLLPGPNADTSIYAPPDSVPVACGASDDPELLALLPRRFADIAMHLQAIVPADLGRGGPQTSSARFLAITGATDESFSGYIVYANIGSTIAAFRVRGADAAALEQGCAVLLDTDIGQMKRRTVGGKALLLVVEYIGSFEFAKAGCYVRGDTLFWAGYGRGIMEYFGALP